MLSKRSAAFVTALALAASAPLWAQDQEPAPPPAPKEAPKEAEAPPEKPVETETPAPKAAEAPKPAAPQPRDPTQVDEEWRRLTGAPQRGVGPARINAPALAPLPTIALRGRILTKTKAPAALIDVGGTLSLVRVGAELSLGVAPPPRARTAPGAAPARAPRQARGRRGAANRRAPTRRTTAARGAPRSLTVVAITDTEVRVKISPDDRILVLR